MYVRYSWLNGWTELADFFKEIHDSKEIFWFYFNFVGNAGTLPEIVVKYQARVKGMSNYDHE